jgi:hypothetical protein
MERWEKEKQNIEMITAIEELTGKKFPREHMKKFMDQRTTAVIIAIKQIIHSYSSIGTQVYKKPGFICQFRLYRQITPFGC